MDPPPPPPTPIDSHHSIEISALIILGILFLALSIICVLLRCLRDRSLLGRLFGARSQSLGSGDCSICLSQFKPEDQIRRLPLCSHSFHEDCIGPWLVSNKTCPLCRSPLDHRAADTMETASIAADVGHDGGSRSWLRDLSRGVSSRALSFRSAGSVFTGSSRRVGNVVDLEAGEEISEYFWWLSTV